jgi:hypothetical protein
LEASNSTTIESFLVEKNGIVVNCAIATDGRIHVAMRRKTKHAPVKRRGHVVDASVVIKLCIIG